MEKLNITISPASSKENDSDSTIVLLKGDLTIDTVDDIKADIISLVKKYDKIIVKCEELGNIDLAGIQVLYSLKKTINKANKKVEFNVKLPEDIETIVNHSGVDIQSL